MKKTISESYIRKLIRESLVKQNYTLLEQDGLYPHPYDTAVGKAKADVLANGYFGMGGEDKQLIKDFLSYFPITAELVLTEDSLKQLNEIVSLMLTGDPADEQKAAGMFPVFVFQLGLLLVGFTWSALKMAWRIFKIAFKLAYKAIAVPVKFIAKNAYEAYVTYTTRKTLRKAAEISAKEAKDLPIAPGSTVSGGPRGVTQMQQPIVRSANYFRYSSSSMKGKASAINDAIIKAGDSLEHAGFGGVGRIAVPNKVGGAPAFAWYVSGIENATGRLTVMYRKSGRGGPGGADWANYALTDEAASAILNSEQLMSDPFVKIIKAAQ